jgi:kynurenine formamidase
MTRIVDLSVKLHNFMPSHKNFQRPIISSHVRHDDTRSKNLGTPDDPITFAMTYIGMMDHSGTHVDAFYHTNPDGLPVDEMPIELFIGKAVVFDLRHIPDLGDIDVREMEAAERKSGVNVDGHIVLLCTGLHARHFPRDSVAHTNPGVTAAATHWLADRNSKLHGVEGPSTDKPEDLTYPNHRVCRDRGLAHYEWLCNLEQLIGVGEFHFQGIPLNLQGGSGSPVRALAFLD